MFTLATEQCALALGLVLGASILMLVLGTQILEPYWLFLMGGVGVAIALYRVRRSRMAPYRLAQLLDRKLQLSDSLSTAWFLTSAESERKDSLAQYQIAQAEELVSLVRPADAFPFAGHRAWAVTSALAAAAFGLFAVRYMVTSSLNLRPSLIPIHLESVFERPEEARSADGHRGPNSSLAEENAKLLAAARENGRRADGSPLQDGKEAAASEASNSSSGQGTDKRGNGRNEEGRPETRPGSNASSQTKSGSKTEGSSGQEPGSKAAPDSKDQSARGQEDSSGLMDKMKDALSSLMAKMRPSANSQGTSPDGQRGNGKSGDPNSAKNGAGQQQKGDAEQASQDQSSVGRAQGETKEKAQASEGPSSDQPAESGSDAHSGVGRQDGDKGVKEAGQLQAMGKLEEIIGKRSANLTGEMTVETPSNKQQLKTEYSQRQGQHTDSGGEINRDEIPLIDQQYVREYMEQVRKQGKGPQ